MPADACAGCGGPLTPLVWRRDGGVYCYGCDPWELGDASPTEVLDAR